MYLAEGDRVDTLYGRRRGQRDQFPIAVPRSARAVSALQTRLCLHASCRNFFIRSRKFSQSFRDL